MERLLVAHNRSDGKGDLRMYALIQFYPVLFIPLILFLFPGGPYNRGKRQLLLVVFWYIIAKIVSITTLAYTLTFTLSAGTA